MPKKPQGQPSLKAEREWLKSLLNGSRMTECFIGPLYGAGWNAAIDCVLKRLHEGDAAIDAVLAEHKERKNAE